MISELELHNFKRFKNNTLSFSPLTLLMGLNGVGKSTAIQALLIIRQSVVSGAMQNGAIELAGELCSIGTGQDLLNEGAGSEDRIEVIIRHTDGQTATVAVEYQADNDALRLTAPVDLGALGALGSATFAYLGAERWGPRLSTPLSSSKAAVADIGVHGERTLSVLAHFQDTLIQAGDPRRISPASASIGENVQAYLEKISPGARLDLTPHRNLDSVSGSFSFVGSGGLRTLGFRPTNVGFGLSYSLPIIVAALTAEPGSILAIENPEAHLHTVGQRELAVLLARTARAGVQVIVETHSREIFYGLRSASAVSNEEQGQIGVLYFEGSPDDGALTVSELTPAHGSLANWPEAFFDAFGSPTDLIAPV